MKKIYEYILYYCILCVIIIITVSFLVRLFVLYNTGSKKQTYNLQEDGVCVIKNMISEKDIQQYKTYIARDEVLYVKDQILHSEKIKHRVQTILNSSYLFHDYIFLLKKSQFHTCHRDYNGDFFNENQKHPSYTMIIYLENMDKCIDVIPKSHTSFYSNAINLTDPTKTVVCKAGDAILFNGNLIHTGTINDREDNMRIQLKISHIDDHETLSFYQNYNKVLDKTNTRPKWVKNLQKHVSCQFPIIGTYSQNYDFNLVSGSSESPITQFIKSTYSKIMYGDESFYDLDTAN